MVSLILLVSGFYIMLVTWLFYLALMMLKQNKDKLTTPTKVIASPLLIIGVVLDVFLNLVVATILFLEIPKELLFTSRCSRHLKSKSNTFRYRFARIICKHFLNPFDNDHCGKL